MQLLLSRSRKRDDESVLKIGVKISGGVGDAVIATRWLRDYLGSLKHRFLVDIYFKGHQATSFIFAGIPGLNALYDDVLFDPFRECYDLSYFVNQAIDTWLGPRKHFLNSLDPQVLHVSATIWKNRQVWKRYLEQHPHFDGALSNLAVIRGLSREVFLQHFTGLDYGGPLLSVKYEESILDRYPDLEQPFITVHDGWDGGFTGLSGRPTKALLKEQWPILVAKIKRFTSLKVVQVGGFAGSSIKGVDLNLKGSLSLKQSAAVLRRSKLHIDTESGLVHLASGLGTRSVVIFGPTNLAFFGYKQNVNVPPNQCGNCWWSTDDWMRACPANYEVPKCMETHDLDHIAQLVGKELAPASKNAEEVPSLTPSIVCS